MNMITKHRGMRAGQNKLRAEQNATTPPPTPPLKNKGREEKRGKKESGKFYN